MQPQPEIQVIQEKKGFSRIITGTASVRPSFAEFKDLPMLETLSLGGRPAVLPQISVTVRAEKGVFSTTYTVLANALGTIPLSNKPGGKLTGFADVSAQSVQYFDHEGNRAGVVNRGLVPLDKPRGISSVLCDDYRLGIEGNLAAVIDLVSSFSLFKAPVLHVLKAVATEAGDLKTVKA
ncbi:MAG: hypothetical protein AB1324_08040 [Candidatus Micrarchaeota archaeon]